MDNSKIKEIAKFIANRDSLQEQVLLEFPRKINAIDMKWLGQFDFNRDLLKLFMQNKDLLKQFTFHNYIGYSFSLNKEINDFLVDESHHEIIAFFQYETNIINGLDIINERKVWQSIKYVGLLRKLIFDKYLKEHDGIQSDGAHTELGIKYWKKLLDDALKLNYNVNTIKNGILYSYNPDKFKDYYDKKQFHNFLITTK